MGESRHYVKFLCLLLMVFGFLLGFYWVPIDFRVDSSVILSHVQYFTSRSGNVTSTTSTQIPTTSSPPSKPPYDCSQSRRRWMADDILCSTPPKFLPQYKNPCFYQTDRRGIRALRCLPYFHIFGVCKSGTTDLYRRLLKHPQIVPNRGVIQKETWYWTWKRYGKNEFKIYRSQGRRYKLMLFYQYLRLFNAEQISQLKVSNLDHSLYSDIVTGSGDPMDFWDQTQWPFIPQNNITWSEPQFTAPDLIKHVLPQIKLILMLRDPIERLYSHYYHGGFGDSAQKFHVDVLSSINVLDNCRREFTLRSCLYNQSVMNEMNVPLYASIYHVHLKNWFDVFPRQQIHIIRTEDFGNDISGHILDLFRFLNLSDVTESLLNNISNAHREYQTTKKKEAGPMFPETWKILRTFFESENQKLVILLNDSRYHWKDVYTKHVLTNDPGTRSQAASPIVTRDLPIVTHDSPIVTRDSPIVTRDSPRQDVTHDSPTIHKSPVTHASPIVSHASRNASRLNATNTVAQFKTITSDNDT